MGDIFGLFSSFLCRAPQRRPDLLKTECLSVTLESSMDSFFPMHNPNLSVLFRLFVVDWFSGVKDDWIYK